MSPADGPGLFDVNDTPPSVKTAPVPAAVAATAYSAPAAEVLPADLARLLEADASAQGGRALVDLVVAAERLASWAQARSNELMAALAMPGVAGPTEQLGRRILHPDADPEDLATEAEISAAMEWEAAQRLAADQLAAVLVQSPVTMRIRVNQAQTMVHDFRVTQAALAQGRICRSKAAVILDRLSFVADPQVRERLEERAAEAAGGRAPGRLGALLDRWVMAADPDAAERRRKAARMGRKVNHRPLPDGMGRLSADLPADSSQAIHDLLTDVGRVTQGLAGEDDRRTLDQCRADLLSDIMLTLAAGDTVSLAAILGVAETGVAETAMGGSAVVDHPGSSGVDAEDDLIEDFSAGGCTRYDDVQDEVDADLLVANGGVDQPLTPATLGVLSFSSPKRQGRPLHTVITMTLDAFAHLSQDPAMFVGHGTITAEWAQLLSEAARSISILVTDDNGHALDASAYVYRPRQQVRDQVRTMNPTCVFATCNRPAHDSQLDHHQNFCHENPAAGGLSIKENLEPLCLRHHQVKTHGGWSSERRPDGSRAFRSPLGTKTVNPPADHPATPPRAADPPF